MDHPHALERDLLQGLQSLSRRRFLKAGLSVGVGLAALAHGVAARAVEAPPAVSYKYLGEVEARVLDKLRRLLLPNDKAGLPSSDDVQVMRNLDAQMGQLGPKARDDLSLAIRGLEYGSLLSFSRFSRLDDAAAHKQLAAWQKGAFFKRGIVATIKSFVLLGYWRDPRTFSFLEYDGPVSQKWGIQRLGNVPLPREV